MPVRGCDGAQDYRPIHGDVWRSPVACRRFSVMHVCGHHDPPHVTGYWWRGESLDPALHDSIPLPRFMASMTLIEREQEPSSAGECMVCGKYAEKRYGGMGRYVAMCIDCWEQDA